MNRLKIEDNKLYYLNYNELFVEIDYLQMSGFFNKDYMNFMREFYVGEERLRQSDPYIRIETSDDFDTLIEFLKLQKKYMGFEKAENE